MTSPFAEPTRPILYLLVPLLLAGWTGRGQNYDPKTGFHPTGCDTGASQKIGAFTPVENYDLNFWDKSFAPGMFKRTDQLIQAIKGTFPGPRGFDSNPIRSMQKGTFVPGGPRPYELDFNFLAFGCIYNSHPDREKHTVIYEATGKFSTASETGTWLYLSINNPAKFFEHADPMIVDGKMHTVYRTHPMIGTLKGIPVFGNGFFEDEYWTPQGNAFILITRPGEKAFVPLTRRQYLQTRWDACESEYQRDTARYSAIKGQDQQLRVRQLMEIARKKMVTIKKNIDGWLSGAPKDSADLPAIVYGHQDTDPCEPWFNPKKPMQPPSQYFIADHSYWHMGQDPAAPQVITIWFKFQSHSWNHWMIKEQFARNFPIEKLQALLDK